MSKMRNIIISVALFAVAFTTYFSSSFITQMDSRWSLLVTISMLRHGDQNLDEYAEVRDDPLQYDINKWHDGHIYWVYPIGGPIVALPIVWVVDKTVVPLVKKSYRIKKYVQARTNRWQGDNPTLETMRPLVELGTASLLCALTVVLVYWIARRRARQWVALVTTVGFAFGTTCWSTASRGLWQHTPSILMVSLALHCLSTRRSGHAMVGLAGIPLAISYLCRPTNAVGVALWGVYVAIFHRKALATYVVCVLAIIVPWCMSNYSTYGSVLAPYYGSSALTGRSLLSSATLMSWGEGVVGQWLSTGRGLLVFSPFYCVIVLCFWRSKTSVWRRFDVAIVLVCIVHTLGVSLFPCWWGGHSYGPRFMTDLLPLLSIMFAGAMETVAGWSSARRAMMVVCVGMAMVFACCVHWAGANSVKVWEWNVVPTNVDFDVSRLWSIKDPQVVSYWTR